MIVKLGPSTNPITTKEDTSGHNYLYNNSILNQHTLQWVNTLAHNGRVFVHRSPSTKPYLGGQHHYYCTPGDCTCMHAVKKGRRLENKKFFELKSNEYRDGIKRKETR